MLLTDQVTLVVVVPVTVALNSFVLLRGKVMFIGSIVTLTAGIAAAEWNTGAAIADTASHTPNRSRGECLKDTWTLLNQFFYG
jgi:hypothetical protein